METDMLFESHIKRMAVDDDFLPALLSIFSLAEREILISTFKFQIPNNRPGDPVNAIYKSLIQAKRKGIDIKIITNIHTRSKVGYGYNKVSADYLKKYSIETRGYKNSRIIHAKYVIVDSQYMLIGSHNITKKAITKNHEASIFVDDCTYASNLWLYFYSIWNETAA